LNEKGKQLWGEGPERRELKEAGPCKCESDEAADLDQWGGGDAGIGTSVAVLSLLVRDLGTFAKKCVKQTTCLGIEGEWAMREMGRYSRS